ncbi:hypothetical protein BT69DRAFT_75130 [Atractiella rhizophila]|nr:hypothetical protein BT69DRAFT_75130 [Atractiella rhizophila]
MFYDRQNVDDAASSSFSVISFDLRSSLQYTDSSSRFLYFIAVYRISAVVLAIHAFSSLLSRRLHLSRCRVLSSIPSTASFTLAGSGVPLLIQPPSSTLQLALLYIRLPLPLSSTVLFCSSSDEWTRTISEKMGGDVRCIVNRWYVMVGEVSRGLKGESEA